jgi:adenylate cyclase
LPSQNGAVRRERHERAWLEILNGERFPLSSSCPIGRASGNMIVLETGHVSRQHALVHLQNGGEFWLVDMGSSNGTFLNKRRIRKPVRLTHGDEIIVGDTRLTFQCPVDLAEEYQTTLAQRTIPLIEDVPCWLLLADIQDFTPLSQDADSQRLADLLGGWISTCKDLIESHGGAINKYLGDGILAYWSEEAALPRQIAETITGLKELQHRADLPFRVVVHFGSVAIGGLASMGEESLMGKEVNLVFRLEKLAGSLGVECGLSEQASAKLDGLVPGRKLGEYELKGFEGKVAFFSC